jgi:chemotaxis protein methyltransferase CheR
MKFSDLLADKMGLYYPEERWGDLEKKLDPVMRNLGFKDLHTCIKWLIEKDLTQEHIHILAYHLTIGETYFFRDFHLYTILEKQILPDILQRRKKDCQLKIWSAGCCTGEEPYSIAIVLHRILPDFKSWQIEMMGTDLNREFLRRAERGVYKKWAFRAMPQQVLETYFEKQPDESYQLISGIRKMVKFRYLNLVEQDYVASGLGLYECDLIFCHNVLIYFSKQQIQKTVNQLTHCLSDQGWLSVTAVEVPFIKHEHLHSYSYKGGTFFKKQDSSLKVLSPHKEEKIQADLKSLPILDKKENKPSSSLRNPSIVSQESENLYEECLILYQKNRYEEVIMKLSQALQFDKQQPTQLNQKMKELSLLVRTYANMGDLLEALEWCEIGLKVDPLNSLLHYLYALIQQALGNPLIAIQSLKSALFIDPDFIVAHYMLGLLQNEQGHHQAAEQSFKIALKLVDHYPVEMILPGTEDLEANHLKNLLTAKMENKK